MMSPSAPPEGDPFWQLVAAASRDAVSHALFLEVLRSHHLSPEARQDILARFEAGGDRLSPRRWGW